MPYTIPTTTAARPWLASARLAALDAALANKCSHADLAMHRRWIFSGSPGEEAAADRYAAALRQIRKANRRQGRARARQMARDRDAFHRWLDGSERAEIAAGPVYESILF